MVDQAQTLLAIALSTVGPCASNYCRSASAATIVHNLPYHTLDGTLTTTRKSHQSDLQSIQAMQEQSKIIFNLNTNLKQCVPNQKNQNLKKNRLVQV